MTSDPQAAAQPTPVEYTVTATLPNEAIAARYVSWLIGGHTAAVVAGGALHATVCRIVDPPLPIRVQSRYRFATRDAFERYVRETAPGLREDGLTRFGPSTGVSFERSVADVV